METVPVALVGDLRRDVPLLTCLDLTAGVDNLDHGILGHLWGLGVNEAVLNLFCSFLSGTPQKVAWGDCSSSSWPLAYGIPRISAVSHAVQYLHETMGDLGCVITNIWASVDLLLCVALAPSRGTSGWWGLEREASRLLHPSFGTLSRQRSPRPLRFKSFAGARNWVVWVFF